jgi:large subunit ribosomal protein L23
MAAQEQTLLAPLQTEKSTAAAEQPCSTVTFRVAMSADKGTIKRAVEARWKVNVTCVRTSIVHGKLKRRGQSIGRQSNHKKAMVTLREGQRIEFLAAE